jgi:hypothetical protein
MTAIRKTASRRAFPGGAAMIAAAVAALGGAAMAQAFNPDRLGCPSMAVSSSAACTAFAVPLASTRPLAAVGCASAMAQPRILDDCATGGGLLVEPGSPFTGYSDHRAYADIRCPACRPRF